MNAVAGVHEDDSQYYEGAVYYEAPFGTRTAVVFAPWGERDDRTEDGWRAEAVLGVKRVLRQTENSVVALQGSALWVSQPEYDGAPRAAPRFGYSAVIRLPKAPCL